VAVAPNPAESTAPPASAGSRAGTAARRTRARSAAGRDRPRRPAPCRPSVARSANVQRGELGPDRFDDVGGHRIRVGGPRRPPAIRPSPPWPEPGAGSRRGCGGAWRRGRCHRVDRAPARGGRWNQHAASLPPVLARGHRLRPARPGRRSQARSAAAPASSSCVIARRPSSGTPALVVNRASRVVAHSTRPESPASRSGRP